MNVKNQFYPTFDLHQFWNDFGENTIFEILLNGFKVNDEFCRNWGTFPRRGYEVLRDRFERENINFSKSNTY